jgi:hypothetical protein
MRNPQTQDELDCVRAACIFHPDLGRPRKDLGGTGMWRVRRYHVPEDTVDRLRR